MSSIEEKCLKFIIKEAISREKISLSTGRVVERGSKKHISEIDKLIGELDYFRKKIVGNNRSLRKERYTISRAIDSLRSIRRKARKEGIKKGIIDELDI